MQYKNNIVDKDQSIPYFPPHCGIQCSIPSKVCPLRKRLPLSCHKNSSQIFDATKLWKHTIPLTYNTKTLIPNISETHCFSPQMRLIAYPDHKTTLKGCGMGPWLVLVSLCFRENVVATCKIGSFLCSLDNLLQKNVLFSFLEIKFQNGAHLKKKLLFLTYFSHFFSHQGKVTIIPSAHISLTYIHVFCSPY